MYITIAPRAKIGRCYSTLSHTIIEKGKACKVEDYEGKRMVYCKHFIMPCDEHGNILDRADYLPDGLKIARNALKEAAARPADSEAKPVTVAVNPLAVESPHPDTVEAQDQPVSTPVSSDEQARRGRGRRQAECQTS